MIDLFAAIKRGWSRRKTMTITYSFDKEQSLILTKVNGELNLALTQDYFAQLQQDKNCPEKAIEIVDFSDVTDFAIRYGEMATITKRYQGIKASRKQRISRRQFSTARRIYRMALRECCRLFTKSRMRSIRSSSRDPRKRWSSVLRSCDLTRRIQATRNSSRLT